MRGTAWKEIGKACALEAAGACEFGTSNGALFSAAYLAGSLIRETVFKDGSAKVGDKMLGVFYQYALASAGSTGGVNLYEGNAMAEGAGRALGMSSAHQVRTALFAEMTGLVKPERDALVTMTPASSTPKPARP